MLFLEIPVVMGKVECWSGKGRCFHEAAGQVVIVTEEITFGTGKF